jgi:choline dehydrogenase
VKSDPVLDRPDIQFHCLPVSGELEGGDPDAKPSLSPYPGLTLAPTVLRPESRGWVRLANPDPLAVPDIVHNYLMAEADQRLSIKAMRMARELAATPSLAHLIRRESYPGSGREDDAALLDYARQIGNTGYHPVGTCRMGMDERAVTDPQLRVRGVDGLRVIDASVMPRLVSGNTNAAAIMIGDRGGDLVLGRA